MADSLGGAAPWVPPYERPAKAAPAAPRSVPKPPKVTATAKVPKMSDDFFGPGPSAPRAPAAPKPPAAPAGVATHHKIISGARSVNRLTTATTKAGSPSTLRSAGGGAVAGAVAGAEVGSIFPVVGTAIGAGAGAVLGGTAGAAKGHLSKKSAKRAARMAKRVEMGPARNVLMAEFLLCMLILALSPLTDRHKTEGAGAFLRRGAATMLLFFVLGLVAQGGRGAAKVAAAGGGVVTLTLLVSSRDELAKIADLLSGTGGRSDAASSGAVGAGIAAGAAAAAAAGAAAGGNPFGPGGAGLSDPRIRGILNTPDTTAADRAAAAAAQRQLDQIGRDLGMLGPPGG